jgi:hypothetical protein
VEDGLIRLDDHCAVAVRTAHVVDAVHCPRIPLIRSPAG